MTHFFILKPYQLAAIALATAAASMLPGPSGETAVLAVEHQWSEAEYHADTAALRNILLPEYRTVSERGIRTRDQLIAAAAKRGDRGPVPPYPDPKIEIHGTTALSTFVIPDSSYSVDVLVYEKGGWHAVYSQHTFAKKI